MSQPLYERYKDALRRGHVAALRGRLDVAIVAYAEAAELAPDRALPHVSLGEVLRRLGRNEEARASFDAALARSPGDEAAMRGRSGALLDLGRRVDAAEDLERLAETMESDGRLDDAVDVARRALDIAESKSRRRLVERLTAAARAARAQDAGPDADLAASIVALPADETSAARLPDGAGPAPDAIPAGASDGGAADGRADEPPPIDAGRLVAEAEGLLDAGDLAAAREKLLAAASLHRLAGRPDAAFDACLILLAAAPSDVELHLTMAELQRDRGWRAGAQEKIRLLLRLSDLDDDPASGQAVRDLVVSRVGAVPGD